MTNEELLDDLIEKAIKQNDLKYSDLLFIEYGRTVEIAKQAVLARMQPVKSFQTAPPPFGPEIVPELQGKPLVLVQQPFDPEKLPGGVIPFPKGLKIGPTGQRPADETDIKETELGKTAHHTEQRKDVRMSPASQKHLSQEWDDW